MPTKTKHNCLNTVRLSQKIQELVANRAFKNRRSHSAELAILIEIGLIHAPAPQEIPRIEGSTISLLEK